jgi:membrane protease YdiL (CAAX protease family)
LGTLLALWYRTHLGTGILPLGLKPFAGVALLIGAAEELVYRGYAQGRLRAVGPVAAVLVAAGLHTAYKGALFAFPPAPELRFDLVTVTAFTFAAGALFGVARERAGSVWPSLVAHAAFDLLVCGDAARAPWWVWH